MKTVKTRRDTILQIRVNEEELKFINEEMERHGYQKYSHFLRWVLLNKEVYELKVDWLNILARLIRKYEKEIESDPDGEAKVQMIQEFKDEVVEEIKKYL